MTRNALIFFAAIVNSLLFFLWAENQVAPSFQSCVSQNSTKQSAESSNDYGKIVAVFVKAQSICSLRLIDRHNGFFAAIAAAIVAAFTFTLWRSTLKLWETGEKQIAVAKESADAALKSANVAEQTLYGTEAPFIFIIIASTDGNAIVTVTSPQGVEYPEHVSYMFHNYGRSPAIIREIYIACIASEMMPDPSHFPPLQGNLFESEIVGPSESSQPKPLPQIASCLPNDGKIHQWASVIAYGHVRYADVFGNHYLSGFCYAFNAPSNSFYGIGGANHNYRRKLTEDENREAEERDTIPLLPSLDKS